MKVLVIYSNDGKEKVVALREEIARRFGADTVLRLHSTDRKKSLLRHAWHKDAVKMMKLADVIVYAVSPKSSTNENVNWELKKALKLQRHIVYLPLEPGLKPENPCLYKFDNNTKTSKCLAEKLSDEEALYTHIQNFNNDAHIGLFRETVDTAVLLEQYKLFLETSENLVSRRQDVNSFYISANTALITIGAGIFTAAPEASLVSKLLVILALSCPGILLNVSWRKMLHSYYINNKGKLKILSMIETKLAASLYDGEWKAMKNKYSKIKYTSFTENEKLPPLVFIFFFVAAIVACLSALFYIYRHHFGL